MITKNIDWVVRKALSKDDFLRIGVTWACLKNLGHLPCSSEALIIEVMGMLRMSRYSGQEMWAKGQENMIYSESS